MKRVAVVGLGLMGGSFVQALSAARPDLELVGIDTDPSPGATALQRGWVSRAGQSLELVRGAEVVVLAVPLAAMPGVLEGLTGLVENAIVTDMTSVKQPVVEAAGRAGVELVAGHPMCGREESGIAAADPELFRGAPWILGRRDPLVEELIVSVGATPVVLSSELHDLLVGGISHAAFALSVAYVLAVSGSEQWAQMGPLAGSGFRDMSRLAAGDPKLYSDIALANAAHLVGWLDAVAGAISEIRRRLVAGDPGVIELFEQAAAARREWSGGRA